MIAALHALLGARLLNGLWVVVVFLALGGSKCLLLTLSGCSMSAAFRAVSAWGRQGGQLGHPRVAELMLSCGFGFFLKHLFPPEFGFCLFCSWLQFLFAGADRSAWLCQGAGHSKAQRDMAGGVWSPRWRLWNFGSN